MQSGSIFISQQAALLPCTYVWQVALCILQYQHYEYLVEWPLYNNCTFFANKSKVACTIFPHNIYDVVVIVTCADGQGCILIGGPHSLTMAATDV